MLVFSEKGSVGQKVYVRSAESRHQGEVMDVRHECRLSARQGDASDRALAKEPPEGPACKTEIRRRRRDSAARPLPVVVAEQAPLVAGVSHLKDDDRDMMLTR